MSEKGDLQAAAQPNPGDSVGPYTVESLLGEGGMGRVYKARAGDGVLIALKLVKAELAQDAVFRKRFDREAGAASRVEHKSVVAVIDTGEHRGIPYMAQHFISGGSLQDKIENSGPLKLDEAVRLCQEVGSGIDALHGVSLIHRDLKPGNILLDEDGHAHITDFGLAKDREASVLTRPGQALGSMDYMAPEQIRGEEVTGLADVYALGCVMFECLSGAPPFADRQGMRILWAHLQDEPPDPLANRKDIPQDVGWAVTRALEKEPGNRPPTGQAYAHMIKIAAGAAAATPDDNEWTQDETRIE